MILIFKTKARPDTTSSLALIFLFMFWNSIRKMADAIANDVRSGLRGEHQNMSMSIEQLEDEIVQYRLAIIKEHILKGMLPL